MFFNWDDSATYIDSGRTLERYLLSVISQPKVIDSMLYETVSYYVPESLLTTASIARRLPKEIHPAQLFTDGRKKQLFDLKGRAIPLRKNRNSNQIGVPGVCVSPRSASGWKSIMVTE